MNFISELFLCFFLVVYLGFILIKPAYRKWWLLAASYLFYATWSIPFISVLLFTTTTDYWMSKIISSTPKQEHRKWALISGLTINLVVLGIFKYGTFLWGNTTGLLALVGYSLPSLPWNIILPLGISFYTFEAISYMVDVYRGKERASNWIDYNFYIMYFPHLISGPIVRFEELISQYKNKIELPSSQQVIRGVELIMAGFLFKVFIADPAGSVADPVFSENASLTAYQAWLGTLAFTAQIYFDFMGYTHIARGCSLLLNIEMPLNFNHPYLATHISDFWNRWHISLSRWIRDYLYIPLGGSRVAMGMVIWNLMLTMLICGAWHGAGWNFILWGAFHGFLLCLYHLFKETPIFKESANRIITIGQIVLTFLLVMLGWIIFRTHTPDTFYNILGALFRGSDYLNLPTRENMLTGIFFLLACFSGPIAVKLYENYYRPLQWQAKVVISTLILVFGWIFQSEVEIPFIYFQF